MLYLLVLPCRPYPTCPTGYIFDHESACDCRPVSFTAFTLLELVIVVIVTGTLAVLVSLAHCYRNGIGFFRHRRRSGRYRSASFRQKVELLSTRFDRSLQGRSVVDHRRSAAAATPVALVPVATKKTTREPENEELIGVSLEREEGDEKSPSLPLDDSACK
jgi:Tfp pilus assembly protein PilE